MYNSNMRGSDEKKKKKKKQKRARSKKQVLAEKGLSVQEASQLITELVEAIREHPPGIGLHRRVYNHLYGAHNAVVCSGCRKPGHKINRCPER